MGRTRRRILIAVAGLAVVNYASALYERYAPHERKREFQRYFGNPFGRTVMRWLPGWAVIETTGRRTGKPRRTPVGGRTIGETFWFVAVDPREAAYMRNIDANPRVRVQTGRRWRAGVAQVMPDDDPKKRMLRLNPLNGLFILLAGRDHVTVRVDLAAG